MKVNKLIIKLQELNNLTGGNFFSVEISGNGILTFISDGPYKDDREYFENIKDLKDHIKKEQSNFK